tara:strand:- start:3806 stop:4267 length:462 start_codon:yes stop_codon:yes gene_type:complete
MAVGTGAISLNEVRTELGLGATASLQDCIDNATAANYDPTYYTAPATSLAEFRGYSEVVVGNTLKVTPTTISTNASSSVNAISVTSNTTYNITEALSWVTLSVISGTGNISFNITIATNNTGAPRSGSVTVTTSSGSPTISRVISISQGSGFE